jgi:hypothetical protein
VDNNNYYYTAGQGGRNEYKEHEQMHMVFVTEPNDKQSQYRRSMEINAIMAAMPKYMYWSDQEVGWDMTYHPRVMPNCGGYVLVVDPTFVGPDHNIKFTKVLINNSNNFNILYWDSMHKLGIKENMLELSRTTFHGIVSGLSCAPMAKVRIDVMFGDRRTCQVENIQVHGKHACCVSKDERCQGQMVSSPSLVTTSTQSSVPRWLRFGRDSSHC